MGWDGIYLRQLGTLEHLAVLIKVMVSFNTREFHNFDQKLPFEINKSCKNFGDVTDRDIFHTGSDLEKV